ncbi:MAG: ABC transporter permease [Thermoflexales bacterium]|nr:ABC transporter permease [Thermoflexales bacterium]
MLLFLLRRLLTIIPVLVAAATLSFGAIHLLPGDPVTQQMVASGVSPEAIAARRHALGWDRPLWVQYGEFVARLARGDLGQSWSSGRSVVTVIAEAAWPTAQLAVVAMLIAVLLGVGLGTLAAVRRGTWVDSASMVVALLGVSTPVAWGGLLAIVLFSLVLGWLPPSGSDGARHLLLPGLVLGSASAGALARLVRSSLLNVLAESYITAAYAKGLPGLLVLARHAWPVTMPGLVAMMAVQFAFMMGGTAVTETLFARQGLGRLMVEAVLTQDLPLVQGLVLVSALVYSLANLAADALHWSIDPRVR